MWSLTTSNMILELLAKTILIPHWVYRECTTLSSLVQKGPRPSVKTRHSGDPNGWLASGEIISIKVDNTSPPDSPNVGPHNWVELLHYFFQEWCLCERGHTANIFLKSSDKQRNKQDINKYRADVMSYTAKREMERQKLWPNKRRRKTEPKLERGRIGQHTKHRLSLSRQHAGRLWGSHGIQPGCECK